MKRIQLAIALLLLQFTFVACSNDSNNSANPNPPEKQVKELTIFHFNDQHGQIDNFAKIKHIVDAEKQESSVLLVCSGDIFSGNPVVDNHSEKGFPMIDLMNKVGVDISVIGNHEFDYGENILKNRMEQAEFDWVCANVDMQNSGIPEPMEYTTLSVDGIAVTFLGLVETNGKEDAIIPSTHPWRVQNLSFEHYQSIIDNYASIKSQEDSDLYVALTHVGEGTDQRIATNYPYFDLIIGGHSHTRTNMEVNGIPIYQAGAQLKYLGKLELKIEDRRIVDKSYELINLSTYPETDPVIKALSDAYNSDANLDDVIGFAEAYHSKSHVGNFYTEALLDEMQVDLTFQNSGGVRSDLDQGEILTREIYEIDPFNNGSVIYTMSVGEIKHFLRETGAGFYYAGIDIVQSGSELKFINKNNEELLDNEIIKLGMNDYIPAVHDSYFTDTPEILEFTTAETLLNYLESNQEPVNFTGYSKYFKYN